MDKSENLDSSSLFNVESEGVKYWIALNKPIENVIINSHIEFSIFLQSGDWPFGIDAREMINFHYRV